jgi:hypothetical protein
MRSGEHRFVGLCAIVGSALLIVGTSMHPVPNDPNDATAPFVEYAADRLWILSHLLQLAGVILMVAALLSLPHRSDASNSIGWRKLADAGAIAAMAVATALYTGFSGLAMEIGMPANSILNLWAITLGVLAWRRGIRATSTPE